jgi:hypothetical protein
MTALAPSLSLPGPRLVRAELLKLRRRRGLVLTVTALTVGAVLVTYGVLASLHAANPGHHGPAGGIDNLGHVMWILSALGAVAAALVGATAGAGDLGAGVFRELVVTGRSRTALFLSRIPGGLAFLFPIVAVAYALAAVASVMLAGSLQAPSIETLVGGGFWVLLSTGLYFVLALGVASLVGSRTTTIGILLAWRLALAPIVLSISFLGAGRDILPDAAVQQLAPGALESNVQVAKLAMSTGLSAIVILAWLAAALWAGGWRTATRDA